MKVNNIDVRKYNAKQLTAEILPPSLKVNYEILPGAAIPVEFETDMELGKIKLCIYFRGKDRTTIVRNMSKFLMNFEKSATLEVDGYKGKFKAFSYSSDYTKMKVKNRYKLNLTCDGYFYDDELSLKYENVTETTLERVGTRASPVCIDIYAKETLQNYSITGFEDEIIVENLEQGKTIVINGEKGEITIGGKTAFEKVDIWKFPVIKESTILRFSNDKAIVTIRYKPMWI